MPNPTVKRAPRPKPQRGFQKGKRGPNKKPDELIPNEADKHTGPILIQTVRAMPDTSGLRPSHSFQPTATSRSTRLNRILQDLIQEVGRETISAEQGWTRIEAVVRRLYADAMSGKTPAQALLFERGWGRVPQPVKLDFQTELKQVVEEAGLTAEEIADDPLLSQLIPPTTIEGDYRDGPASTD